MTTEIVGHIHERDRPEPQSGWLIEAENASGEPIWFKPDAESSWTKESDVALRFGCQQDADEYARIHLGVVSTLVRTTLHVWG